MAERFKIHRLIGKSAFGGIYEATDAKSGKKILLKRFFSERGKTSVAGWGKTFLAILRDWKLIDCTGMVKLYDGGIDEDGAYMCLHYFESEPLLTYYPRVMSFRELRNFATQSLKILEKLHNNNIVHGALVPNSFLVSKETISLRQYFLCDLGLSQLVPKINSVFARNWFPSDPALLAPELFEKHPAVSVTDIYMLGHIFYYMVLGGHPFADLPFSEAERRHYEHDIPRLDDIIPDLPGDIATWIQSMMLPHPEDRTFSAEEALANMPHKDSFKIADYNLMNFSEQHAIAKV